MSQKKKSAKKKPAKAAKDMVKPSNIVILKKKPEPDQLPPVAIDIVAILAAKGGELRETELVPALAEKVGAEEPARTAWSYWRGVLEAMGILSVKEAEV